jgi:hypothetical protein
MRACLGDAVTGAADIELGTGVNYNSSYLLKHTTEGFVI